MGGKALAIVPSYEGENAVSGDYLKGEIESDMFSSVGEKLNPLSTKVESMIEQADSLLYGLNHIIDEPTRNHLQSSIAKFNQSMLEFSEISKNINLILDKNKESLELTLTNAKDITTKFSTLTDTLNKELEEAQIANTVKELKATISGLNKVIANLEKGEGSAGKLLKDDQLYTNLSNASKELEELLREMKEHPKRFVHFSVFGKKDKKE
jgi:phospholipid/cholesterol/gamma-HCH transport system substrate-binding protein